VGRVPSNANVRQWSHFKVMLQRFKVPGLTTLWRWSGDNILSTALVGCK
jgi:hypothetical protein